MHSIITAESSIDSILLCFIFILLPYLAAFPQSGRISSKLFQKKARRAFAVVFVHPLGSKIVFSPGSLNVTGTIAVLFSFSPSYSAKITYFSPVSFRDTLTSLSDKNNIFVSVSFAIVLFILTISEFLPQTSVIVPVADPSAEAVAGVTVNSLTSAVTFVYPLSESPAFILYSSCWLPYILQQCSPLSLWLLQDEVYRQVLHDILHQSAYQLTTLPRCKPCCL